jgi:hypothetical protein
MMKEVAMVALGIVDRSLAYIYTAELTGINKNYVENS